MQRIGNVRAVRAIQWLVGGDVESLGMSTRRYTIRGQARVLSMFKGTSEQRWKAAAGRLSNPGVIPRCRLAYWDGLASVRADSAEMATSHDRMSDGGTVSRGAIGRRTAGRCGQGRASRDTRMRRT